MNARLPESLEETNVIERMKIGDSGFTVPWAMFVDAERRCWLNGKYNYWQSPFGTATLRVERTPDGYIVDVRQCDDRWRVGMSSNNHVGGAPALVAVVRIKEA